MPGNNSTVYLTFDDGPTEGVTPWVLDKLKEHSARATFFCLGKKVEMHPDIYQRILDEGHAVGNHSYSHL
ncbi:MAG: polysaccharide deacetylase family protein, partial [Tenuifilaceae bacterium]